MIKKKSEEVKAKVNSGTARKRSGKNEKITKFLEFLQNSDDNLQRIEDSIRKNIYLFKHCVR